MSKVIEGLQYSRDHEWVRQEGDIVCIGITDHAQDQLGDVVYLELPEVGDSIREGEPFGVVESVKAVSDLVGPLSGEVVESNVALVDTPELVNSEPYEGAWMIRVRVSQASETLMDSKAYTAFLGE